MAEPGDFEIIAGVGNEVFYFFVVVVLCILVLLAWSSTQVVEPVVQSVILVERTAVGGATAQASSAEEVREAVTQFLQRQPEEEVEVEEWNGGERNAESEEVEDGEREVQQQQVEQVQVVEQELPEEDRVTIRLKFLNETQKEVEASLVENLGQFKRRNFTEEIGNNKNVRLIFNGQVLRDEGSSLRSCGLFDKCVVHCLVSNLPSTGGAGSQQQASARSGVADHHHHHNQGAAHGHHHQVHHHGQPLDVSAFFIPLLGLALAMVWYLALAYNSYFNFMSTTALLGLTSLYFLSVYGTHFHVNVAVRTAVPPEPHH